ncbi:hypothetical protein GLAREA_02748 [Glarea lozoyensis ATCC 20868]|uniref:Uncharacterized protein n=1 Tax=Glarea lozoyensis (strain ATCC 20868 / MF5171) TaxID=1116229 RepID=S3CNU6_GLAL2|nr:uncharacterized protein GLAREA_02748 [Glarea lozoyensis ATCC 20868]EPE26834.1 hypothetical protein GLAREA_02748 [Glarea lozoyensis ATCC 20868]
MSQTQHMPVPRQFKPIDRQNEGFYELNIYDEIMDVSMPMTFSLHNAMNNARIVIEAAGGEVREDRPNRRGWPILFVLPPGVNCPIATGTARWPACTATVTFIPALNRPPNTFLNHPVNTDDEE